MDQAMITGGPGMDMPIFHDSDRYDLVRDIGSGNFGVARLMRDKVILTPTHLAIVMEYASREELFEQICNAGHFSEDERILSVQYSIPACVQISEECCQLISRIFVADPAARITVPEIKKHVWFLRNLPADLMDEYTMGNHFQEPDQPMQSTDLSMQIVAEVTIPTAGTHTLDHYLDMDNDMDNIDSESELDVDSSGEIVYAL